MRHLVHRIRRAATRLWRAPLPRCSLRTGVGAAQVVAHLRYFESGQELALLHAVADIEIDFLDIAGDLRHHIDFLERLELGRQHEIPGEVFRRYFGHRDGGNIRRGSRRSLLSGAGNTEQEDQTHEYRGKPS